MSTRLRVLVWLTISLAMALPSAAQDQPPITLGELERLSLESHPSLARAEAAVAAATGRAEQAGRMPNPAVSYVGEEIAGGPINRGGEHGVSFQQTIPLGGKLTLRRDALAARHDEADAERSRARMLLRLAVRSAYTETLAAQRRVEVREQQATLARELA